MKNQTAVMCHNIAKYNREHQQPDLTPLEAAERLETIDQLVLIKGIGPEYDAMRNAVKYAASYLRKIAAGEYKRVVHATWIESNQNNSYSCRLIKCSNCGETHIVPYTISLDEWAENRNYCGSCGALMHKSDMGILQGGKD